MARPRNLSLYSSFVLVLALAAVVSSETEPKRVRHNFLGMHNLKGGGVTPFQTGMDWTKTLVGDGFILDWVTDYAPDAPDHWIEEAMRRGLVPAVRVQHCQKEGNPDCAPSVGYSTSVATQILDWKVAHPEYADRYVYLQLWNEPGDARDYVPMDQYADYLVAAYREIRNAEKRYAEAHPGLGLEGTLLVMTPGQNDGWDTAFNHNPQAKFSFDVWATHPYPDLTPPWINIHDGDLPPNSLKTIDSYIQDLDEVAKTHQGVPGRRGFPVMITETNYGYYVGNSTVGWPKLTQETRAPYMVDAYFERWYRWPEVLAVHPFLLNNVKWPGFEFVHSWTSQDVEAPFGVLEPANPYPIFTAVKEKRLEVEAQGRLAPARLSPYRGPTGTIRGRVTRSDTGEPVPYATLATDGYEYGHLTLFDGIYEIHDVPVGSYRLSFEKASYRPASQPITVTEGKTTVADFSVVFTGRVLETLYKVDDRNGGCDGSCANLNAVDHWQSFVTGPETGYIKFASCQIHGDGITMKFTLHANSPNGPQVGTAVTARNPERAGDQMIGWQWPDGQEPRVEPNTRYWVHFQREDGSPIYTYASSANPYPQGDSSSSGGVDFYGTIYGLTRDRDVATGAIGGTVTDANGHPLAGVTVTRVPGNLSTTTSSDGRFTLSGVPVGTYDVTASKSGFLPQTVGDQNVEANRTTGVDFSLATLPPTIALSTTTLIAETTAGTNAPSASFTLRNSGGGVLSYTVQDDAGWLSVSPASGTSSGETDTLTVTYQTSNLAAGAYSAKITVAAPGATNSPRTIAVSLNVRPVGTGTTLSEDFEKMPAWTSQFDASWGGAASWTLGASGQSGKALTASRTSPGSSSKVLVFAIEPGKRYTLSLYMRSGGQSSSYWAEAAYRLGSNSAQDFDANASAWSLVQKFSSAAGGNGGVWKQYSTSFASGSATSVSVGLKLGATGAGPSVSWDSLRLTTDQAPPPPGGTGIAEDFDALPSWSSSLDANWGGAASWSIASGGSPGTALRVTRASSGSSAKVLVYPLAPNTTYRLRIRMRSSGSASGYWAETAYRLGELTAQDFDANVGAWTMVQKFSNGGTNGNGDTWTEYTATFASGSATRLSVGFKLGSSGAAPAVLWDTLRVEPAP